MIRAADRRQWPPERVERLASGVHFFNEVRRQDPDQFLLLLQHCELLQADPGDVVIRQDDEDRALYFLLRGQLAVLGTAPGEVLNYIAPGEVFGALAMLRGTARTATIRVDDAAREAVLARIDYRLFSDLDDMRLFTLETRIAFYHMLVHNIRWTLEVGRMQDPHHPVVSELRKVPLYGGRRGTREELMALHQQAHVLAELLCRWNAAVVPQHATQVT